MEQEKVQTLIKPEIQRLIDRGNVQYWEYECLFMNTYERNALIPAMSNNCLLEIFKVCNNNIQTVSYPTTYEQVILSLIAPQLATRLEKTS